MEQRHNFLELGIGGHWKNLAHSGALLSKLDRGTKGKSQGRGQK